MSMKSFLAIAATTLGLGLLAPNAQAALIPGVTASTNMGSVFTPIANGLTVNGTGLPANVPSLTGNHATAAANTNAWFGARGNLTGNITFNLNGSYNLAGFSFWNFNGINTLGIKGVTVQSSTDGMNFSAIAGAPTQFSIGANNAPEPPEVFSFSPVTVSFVRFVVGSNWGNNNFTGFSEVQFDSAPAVPPTTTPEPANILGLLVVGGGLLATKRRKG